MQGHIAVYIYLMKGRDFDGRLVLCKAFDMLTDRANILHLSIIYDELFSPVGFETLHVYRYKLKHDLHYDKPGFRQVITFHSFTVIAITITIILFIIVTLRLAAIMQYQWYILYVCMNSGCMHKRFSGSCCSWA